MANLDCVVLGVPELLDVSDTVEYPLLEPLETIILVQFKHCPNYPKPYFVSFLFSPKKQIKIVQSYPEYDYVGKGGFRRIDSRYNKRSIIFIKSIPVIILRSIVVLYVVSRAYPSRGELFFF